MQKAREGEPQRVLLPAQIAEEFFVGMHFYMRCMEVHANDMQPLVEGITLPK